jgi:DNA-binding transcriptional LysR family regulator
MHGALIRLSGATALASSRCSRNRELLDAAGVPWTEIFVGGGVAAVAAAVMAGLGVAALAPRMLPFGAVDVGSKLGLPDLRRLPVLLHSRIKDGGARDALAALSAAFRSAVRS